MFLTVESTSLGIDRRCNTDVSQKADRPGQEVVAVDDFVIRAIVSIAVLSFKHMERNLSSMVYYLCLANPFQTWHPAHPFSRSLIL